MRLLGLLSLVCAGLFALGTECRPKETVVSETAIQQWFSDRELDLLGKKLVVQARTISRDDEREEIETCMEIEHVFYGPAFLKNRQFRVVSPKKPPWSGFVLYPAPDLNDVGIWCLQVSKNALSATPSFRGKVLSVPTPVFQKDRDDYQIAFSHCKAVEEVSHLPDREKQLSRLKQLALSRTPENASWATTVLVREKPDGIADFLRGLIANEKSTVIAQVVADEALMKLDRKAWQHSNERIAMVKKWVHRKSSLREAMDFSEGLSRMTKHIEYFGIRKKNLLDFLSVAVLNDEIPSEGRCAIIRTFGDFPKQFKDDEEFQDEVFQVLANMVVKSKDQSVKLEAAQTLATTLTFESKKRQTRLRELMESEESGEGGRFLRDHFDIDSIE